MCVSLSRLAHSINTQLKGNITGYVTLIGRSRVFASGLARTAADPPQLAMGPDVMVNVASVGKMFTTIAVLQSLARRHLSIDSWISPFLPPDWVKGPGVGTITFGELLTHRAGFRLNSARVFETDNAAREQIRHGIQISGEYRSTSASQACLSPSLAQVTRSVTTSSAPVLVGPQGPRSVCPLRRCCVGGMCPATGVGTSAGRAVLWRCVPQRS